MPFIAVPNAAQFEIRMLWDNQEVENTLWFEAPSAFDSALLDNVAVAVATWFQGSILPNLSSAVQFVEVYGTDMSSATGPTATAVPSSAAFGGVLSPSLPNNVAMCVSFRTAGRGRNFRGRNYVPGMAEDGVTGNAFLASRVANIVGGYNGLLAVATGQGVEWVVASRYLNNAPRVTGITTPVTAALVTDTYVDSQRRRLPGRGR